MLASAMVCGGSARYAFVRPLQGCCNELIRIAHTVLICRRYTTMLKACTCLLALYVPATWALKANLCGVSFEQAVQLCGRAARCPLGTAAECPGTLTCFNQVTCPPRELPELCGCRVSRFAILRFNNAALIVATVGL